MVEYPVQQEDSGSNPTPPLQVSARSLVIELCPLSDIRQFVETNHYSHSLNGVKISFCFSVKSSGCLVGAVVYGAMSTTAWKKFGKEEESVIELRRLVLLDSAEKNSESRVISFTLRWLKKNVPRLKIVVSYADPMHGHTGTVYRACNFVYLGLSGKDTGFLNPETGKIYHSRALRTKYKGDFKPFVKRLRDLKEKGLLTPIVLPGKHCFVYHLVDVVN